MERRKHLAFAIVFLCACSSAPVNEKYRELDGDTRQIFLAYYPILTPDQRYEWLDDGLSADSFMKNWAVEHPDVRDQVVPMEYFQGRKETYTLTGVDIEAGPVMDGRKMEFKATVRYKDGRKAEITQDSAWSVQPALAWFDGAVMKFECISSDVVVTANFLGEAQGSRAVSVRKPLRELELKVADPAQSISRSEYVKLAVIARCEDGTTADVSCQAVWETQEPGAKKVEFAGCGHLRLAESFSGNDPVTVAVSYGGLSKTLSLKLPPRIR